MTDCALVRAFDCLKHKHGTFFKSLRLISSDDQLRFACSSLGVHRGWFFHNSVDRVRLRHVLVNGNVPLCFVDLITQHFGDCNSCCDKNVVLRPDSTIFEHTCQADNITIDFIAAFCKEQRNAPNLIQNPILFLRPAEKSTNNGAVKRPFVMFGSVSVVRCSSGFQVEVHRLKVPEMLLNPTIFAKMRDEIANKSRFLFDFVEQASEIVECKNERVRNSAAKTTRATCEQLIIGLIILFALMATLVTMHHMN